MSKFSITKKKEYKLSEEAALQIVLKACVAYDIDVDCIEDKKQKKGTEALLNALLDYVRRGFIDIDTKDFSMVQHLQEAPGDVIEVNYKTITGKQKLEMDGKDENDRYAQMYAVLGAASGLGEDAIQKLKGVDLKVAEALTIFFL
jgi:hypothetical protein